MDGQKFAALKATLEKSLTVEQCVELEALAKRLLSAKATEAVVAKRAIVDADTRTCPHCHHSRVVKHGKDARDRQRFRCLKGAGGGCGRTFNGLTGTPLARMRKPETWLAYARLMTACHSVDEIHRRGLGISRLTAWRWRLRFLALPALLQAERLDGIIEADETFFLRSFKGSRGWKRGTPPENRPPRYRGSGALKRGISGEQVPVLTALDRTGAIVEEPLATRSRAEVLRVLATRVAQGALICSDGYDAYRDLAKAAKAQLTVISPQKMTKAQKIVGGKPRKSGRLTLGRVNSHHERLKTGINRELRGVSTRYLPLYLGWLRLTRRPDFKPELFIETALAAPL